MRGDMEQGIIRKGRRKAFPSTGAVLAICWVVGTLLSASGCATVKGSQGPAAEDEKTTSPFFQLMPGGKPAPDPTAAQAEKKKEMQPLLAQEKGPPQPAPAAPKAPAGKPGGPQAPPQAGSNPLLEMFSGRKAGGREEKPKEAPAQERTHLELAFDNADLYEVLDATLYEIYKVNYILDPSIRTKVTFHLEGEYSQAEFINVINEVLQLSNLAIVKGPGKMFKVVRRTVSQATINAPITPGKQPEAGDATRMIRLLYISPAEAAKNIRSFLSAGASVVADLVTNSLIVTDTQDNIEKAASILSAMDVPYFTDISWRVIRLKHAMANDTAAELSKILKAGGLYNRPGVNPGSVEVFPIKTLNAIMVVTRWPSMLDVVAEWISAMDHADESETTVFVYFVENASALELSDVLRQLFMGSSAGGISRKKTLVKPQTEPTQPPAAGQPTTPTTPTTPSKPRSALSGELAGEVEIIPDETNNAIVFKATNRDYKIIREVLKQLDIVPRQVLINAVIAEISLNDQFRYGVEWFLKSGVGSHAIHSVLDGTASRGIDTALGGAGDLGPNFQLAVFNSVDVLKAIVTALGSDSQINILSSPNILAVDNKEAIIEVGDEIPTITGQVSDATTTTTITNTVQFRKTGVILKVTPHINSTGLVKMDITQEVTVPGDVIVAGGNVAIQNRRAVTSLVAEDGQTIVIAGLMSSTRNKAISGFPVLKDIPVLGALFGARSDTLEKTELIILITPHVIHNRQDADQITAEFTKTVSRVQKFIEQQQN